MFSVILVDDEPWALYGIHNSFNWGELSFEVIGETTNSLEALTIIETMKPDVVFVDVKMPGMSGIELIKLVRQKEIYCEFIVVSGFAEFEFAKEAVKFGVFYYLLKPIDIEEGNEVINKLSEKLRQRKDGALNHDMNGLAIDLSISKRKSDPHMAVNESFKELLTYVNSNFHQELSLHELSSKYHLYFTYICELFKKVTGKTFSKYVMDLRINTACELLKTTDLPVCRIAEQVGYEVFYFNTLFKREIGTTPMSYRKGREN
jgi:two-component system, response regulator YesN